MLFTQLPPLPLLICPRCRGIGIVGTRPCPECRGLCVGIMDNGLFVFYGAPFTRYAIALRRARRILDALQIGGALAVGAGLLFLFVWRVVADGMLNAVFTTSFWTAFNSPLATAFWISVISFLYTLYRARIASRRPTMPGRDARRRKKDAASSGDVFQTPPGGWAGVRQMSRGKKVDIAPFFTDEALRAMEAGYRAADEGQFASFDILHLFRGILAAGSIRIVFLRVGLPVQTVADALDDLLPQTSSSANSMPLASDDVLQALFSAYREARANREPVVQAIDLLIAAVQRSEAIQRMLYGLGVEENKLEGVIAWERIRERLRRDARRFRQAAAHHSKYGLDRAMTAVATPFLNVFSADLTMMAAFGHLSPCVGRDSELEEIFRIVQSGDQHVLLVGEHGVGKMSIIGGIAARMVEGDVPERLFDKRLVQLSPSHLLAGTTMSGAQERLIRIVREIKRAGNIILFIHNIHELMQTSDSHGQGMDAAETLAEFLGDGRLLLLATTTPDEHKQTILHSALGTAFTAVNVSEMDEAQTLSVLESKAGEAEYRQQVFFSYDALEASAEMAKQFLRDRTLPESAIALMNEAASFARNTRGANQIVSKDDVGAVVGEKTGVPATTVSETESEKLLRLEEEMQRRVVGQDEAVSLVANALRRARAKMRSQAKPIANFLFLGPTGVGKTELAKTIADVYFGKEDRMIRFDMSEFQDAASVYRLIGEPGKQGTGLLTEAVREHPFSLILLDELEKADPDVLNIFLQVFDDGRLTDSVGRVADFTNAIIIATSNAGTAFVQEQVAAGAPMEETRHKLIHGVLKDAYRPEFLNRFDAIVLFRPLSRADIKEVAKRMLARVGKNLEERGIEMRIEDAGLNTLADAGFDPEFGARPLRRAIQDTVENALAELILSGKIERGDTAVVGESGQVRVEKR